MASAVAPGASVVRTWPLVGGVTSSVDACVVQMQSGARVTVVLRRWRDRAEDPEATDRVDREAATLRQLAGTGIPAPELVAVDRDGEGNSGRPSLLMTRVPGQVDLQPKDPQRWLQQLASVLPVIHEAAVQAPHFRPWMDVAKLSVPGWSARPALWQRAIELVRSAGADHVPAFIHRDFQHFNVLWSRGRLVGVVDWVEASTGPADVDVGHCRLNLAVLFSAEWAERFRMAYEQEAGRSVDPYWDLHALVSYLPGWDSFIQVQAGKRAVLDRRGMHARVEEVLSEALRRC